MIIDLRPNRGIIAALRRYDPTMTGVPEAGAPEYDLMLRVLGLVNDSDRPVRVRSIRLELTGGGRTLEARDYRDSFLASRLDLARGIFDELFPALLPFVFGTQDIPAWPLSADLEIPPAGALTLLFETFRFRAVAAPDTLRVEVTHEDGFAVSTVEAALPVEVRTNRNRLLFPVPENPSVILSAYDLTPVLSHRRLQSQEYALDIVQPGAQGGFIPPGRVNTNYPCHGAPVRAVAPGEVVEAVDGLPENRCGGDARPPDDEIGLLEGFDPMTRLIGNHVTIRHDHGECSQYCHLLRGSVLVSPGDRVEAGAGLGRIGHNGMSGGPHLHFSLMDGPDNVTAQGIPCVFENLWNAGWDQPASGILESHWIVRPRD